MTKDGKFRMILVADLHYGANNDEHLNEEVQEILVKYIKKHKKTIDMVEFLGDCSHRQLSMNETASKYQSNLFMTINKLSMENNFKFKVLKGTLRHDYNQLEMYRKLEIINPNFKIITTVEIDLITVKDKNNDLVLLKFLQIPEEYMEDPEEYYKSYLNPDEAYDFTMVHGTFDFAGYVAKLSTSEHTMKNAPTFKSKDFEKINVGCTFSGHVHTQMDSNNVFYIGSFSRFVFGEEEPKGFYDVTYDLETGETEILFIENTLAPTYITITNDKLPKDTKKKIAFIKKMKEQYDFVRIKALESSSNQDDVELLKEFSKNDDSIKLEVTHVDEENINHEYDFLFDDKISKEDKMIMFSKKKIGVDITKKEIEDVLAECGVKDYEVFLKSS